MIDLLSPPEMADDVTRALPHALGPEKSILSSMLQIPDMVGLAMEKGFSADHFYMPGHQILFGWLVKIHDSGKQVELVSLIQDLLDHGDLDRVGGPATLSDIYTYAPSAGHFEQHLEKVREKYVLRLMIQNANETISEAYDSPGEVMELLDSVESRFMGIRNAIETAVDVPIKRMVEEFAVDLQQRMSGERAIEGISTGYRDMDAMGVTLKPGEVTIIAARPSMGKTALLLNMMEKICIDRGESGMFFSLEMTYQQLTLRLGMSRARWTATMAKPGYVHTRGELERMQRSLMEIGESKLHIDDQHGITIHQLRAKARRMHKKHGLQLIGIDYLQLMKSVSKQAQGSREREVAEISGGVKNLAKELGIPIIILAQLNRGPENRTGKDVGKPRLSDLRESGAIEQDADIVGLLYRPGYYAKNDDQKAQLGGESEFIIAKNRNGSTGMVPLVFIDSLTRFENAARQDETTTYQSPQELAEDIERRLKI